MPSPGREACELPAREGKMKKKTEAQETLLDKFPKQPPGLKSHDAPVVLYVWEALGCKDHLTKSFIRVAFFAIRVFDWKQQHYGVKNIARAGWDGVRIRLGDKVSRLDNLAQTGEDGGDEGIEDTLGDCGVYGLIGLMCRWGLWPGVEKCK